jgi:cell volume regulation protein A
MDYLHTSNLPLLAGALLVLIGIASSLLARRFGAPLLLVFLILGMLLGVDGPGGIRFHDYQATYLVGSLALAIILFDGGLRTRISEARDALLPASLLASVGVLVTAGLTGAAAMWLFHFNPIQGLLLGAIVASTDAAAVFFLLRAGGLHLNRRVGATLELESGGNDPVAVFLTVLLTGWLALDGSESAASVVQALLLQVGLGLGLGAGGGMLIALALNRLTLPSGLHPLLALAGAIAVFALTNLLGGSGFLAAYLAGLVVGNRPLRAYANVLAVNDAATWLGQGVMFLLLGVLAGPRSLLDVLWPALAIAGFLMLVARPLAVVLCLAPFRYRLREIGFVSWVGLRGAVGIFLASIPMLAKLPDALLYFNVAFVVVCASLLIQGWTMRPAATLFRVALPRRDPPMRRVELDLPGQLEYELVGYRVMEGSAILRGAAPPGWARPAMVVRAGSIALPDQAGPLQADDYAYFLAPPGRVYRLDWLFAVGQDAAEAEREMFGTFALAGDVPLGELAEFYGLPIPERHYASTAAQLFDKRFDGNPQIGDRLTLGQAMLIVRQLDEERVSQVGLKFVGVGSRVFGADAGAQLKPGPLQRLYARWRRL